MNGRTKKETVMLKILNDKMVMLGLSDENIRRLGNDEPIKLNLNSLGLPDQEILIFSGKDEETMFKRFKHKPEPIKNPLKERNET